MKLSRSTEYALLALDYLTRESHGRPILAKEIARHHSIPSDYLLKVLHSLVRGGLLESNRGPLGGYRLGRSPGHVTLLHVIEAVEGPFDGGENEIIASSSKDFVQRVQDVYRRTDQAVKAILDQTTLAALVLDGLSSDDDIQSKET